jgi:flagellar motor switch protein FliN
MSESMSYLDCWISVATSLFSQALLGQPVLADSLPKPMPDGSFGFAVTLEGEEEGRFAVLIDGTLGDANLFGEGVDQKAGWAELLKEVAEAAAGEVLARTGRKTHVTAFVPITGESKLSRAFQLKAGGRTWLIQVNSEVRLAKPAKEAEASRSTVSDGANSTRPSGRVASPASDLPSSSSQGGPDNSSSVSYQSPVHASGFELLLDVELEASLRFGAREMPLGEILDLGPGDVVQLDRHINDPVDLIVGDKIVARGEVVLVNGNFGLRVTAVAEPQKRLESIRCLF